MYEKTLLFLFAGICGHDLSIASCTKADDNGNDPWQKQSSSRLTVADAKKFFEREASGFYTRASGRGLDCGDACGHDHDANKDTANPDRGLLNPGVITPDWMNAEVVPGQTVSKVVTPINTQYRYVAARKETDKNGKTKTYKSTIVQRLYVGKNSHGDNAVYIEVLIPDKSSRAEKHMPANIHDSKYSGIVMYFTVDNGFGWYYKFKSGKVVERISIYDFNAGNVERLNAKILGEIGRIIKYKTGGMSRNGDGGMLKDVELGEVDIVWCKTCNNRASECTCNACYSCGFSPCICDYICVYCGKIGCFESCFKCPDCMNPMSQCSCYSGGGGSSGGESTGGGSTGGGGIPSTGGGPNSGSGTLIGPPENIAPKLFKKGLEGLDPEALYRLNVALTIIKKTCMGKMVLNSLINDSSRNLEFFLNYINNGKNGNYVPSTQTLTIYNRDGNINDRTLFHELFHAYQHQQNPKYTQDDWDKGGKRLPVEAEANIATYRYMQKTLSKNELKEFVKELPYQYSREIEFNSNNFDSKGNLMTGVGEKAAIRRFEALQRGLAQAHPDSYSDNNMSGIAYDLNYLSNMKKAFAGC